MTLRIPTNRFGRHLLFWALVWVFFLGLEGLFPLLIFGTHSTDARTYWIRNWTPFVWVQFPIMLVYSYCATYILLPLALQRRYGRFSLGVVLVVILTWFLFGLLGLSYLVIPEFIQDPTKLGYKTIKQVFANRFFMLDFIGNPFFRINVVAGIMAGIKLFNQWRQKQYESQRMEREKLQTELKLIKLQLNPDFLFGSLTTLHQLTQQQSKQAPEAVLKLAHFLRYVLYESQTDEVPLAWEINLIEQYVFLQRAMHQVGLEVSLTIRGKPDNQRIAPLLLFPIVENAFRQLPAEGSEPFWVSIDLVVSETHLTLKVIDGQGLNQPNEFWLVDLQKQLHFFYTDEFDLQTRSEPDAYIVSLTLPLFIVSKTSLADTQPLPKNKTTTRINRSLETPTGTSAG